MLCFSVADGERAGQSVEVKIVKGLLFYSGRRMKSFGCFQPSASFLNHIVNIRVHLHFSSNKFDLRVIETCSAIVSDGGPAIDGYCFSFFRSNDVVGGGPVETVTYIRQLSWELSSCAGADLPAQGGAEDGVVAKGWEDGLAGKRELKLSTDLDDGAGIAASAGDVARADDLASDSFRFVIDLSLELDGLAFEVLEEEALRDGIVPIALLENGEVRVACGIAQDNGVWADLSCGLIETDRGHSLFQIQVDGFPDNADALVVNCQTGISS